MDTNTLMKEFVSFLKSNSSDMRYMSTREILGLLADDNGFKLISENDECVEQLFNIACNDKELFIKKLGFQCLINLSSDETLAARLAEMDNCQLIKVCLDSIANKTPTAEACTMLLSNLTRSDATSKLVWDFIKDGKAPDLNLEVMARFVYEETQDDIEWDHLAQVLCNLSQLTTVRKELTAEGNGVIKPLLTTINSKSPLKKKGVVGTVRNCCFDTDCHEWLLSDDVNIVSMLVYPLAGPEELDEDENEKLPLDLQYLEPEKERESNPEIRKMLLDALLQLCATKSGRTYMKENGIYYLMRELHKWEEDKSVLVACENLVDILIGDEPKVEMENLKAVEIPQDLLEKFKKMDEEDNL